MTASLRPVARRALGKAWHVEAHGRDIVIMTRAELENGRGGYKGLYAKHTTSSAGLARAAAPRVLPLLEQFELSVPGAFRAAVELAEAAYRHAQRRRGKR